MAKTIIQVSEQSFRKSGKYGDALISILKDRDMDIKNGRMYVRTNLAYNHSSSEIKVFNQVLRNLRMNNIVGINIILD
tara:strand:- start:362 stop:595 length:234 start_codon:yes stop_codon:yes gene_type:complete